MAAANNFATIRNLKVSYSGKNVLKCDDLEIRRAEMLALVGESGCGKTTFAKALAGLLFPDPCSEIKICCPKQKVQMVFQDPYASLNPKMRVEQIVKEGLTIQNILPKKERSARCCELLEQVGLSSAFLKRYPSELSGGQRQRVGIARALAVEPELLILDEPVSALDPELQSEILSLLKKLQRERALTCLLIAHDLPLVKSVADRIAVMYLGEIVELGCFERPAHPYTEALFSAVPVPDPKIEKNRSRIILNGELPTFRSPPQGCPFHTRCPKAEPLCKEKRPPERRLSPDHSLRCHLF